MSRPVLRSYNTRTVIVEANTYGDMSCWLHNGRLPRFLESGIGAPEPIQFMHGATMAVEHEYQMGALPLAVRSEFMAVDRFMSRAGGDGERALNLIMTPHMGSRILLVFLDDDYEESYAATALIRLLNQIALVVA